MICLLGTGGYSSVEKARDERDKTIVALKRVKIFDKNLGVPISFYREIYAMQDENLKKCNNILKLKEVVYEDEGLTMVLEYCDYDLSTLIKRFRGLSLAQTRFYARQLLNAVAMVHNCDYVHRDIKPANVLVTYRNVVKLGDFGLARKLTKKGKPLTKESVTPSYRAPEILLGDTHYGKPVDVWSLGCVLFEMITGRLLFNASTSCTLSQLQTIFRVCGTPTPEEWPEFKDLPNAKLLNSMRSYPSVLEETLKEMIPDEFDDARDLIARMLQLNPARRITVADALCHPFFAAADVQVPDLTFGEKWGRLGASEGETFPMMCMRKTLRVVPPPISAGIDVCCGLGESSRLPEIIS